MGKEEKLNIRIEPRLKELIKAYAKRHGTTVSALVSKHFQSLLTKEHLQSTLEPGRQI